MAQLGDSRLKVYLHKMVYLHTYCTVPVDCSVESGKGMAQGIGPRAADDMRPGDGGRK